MKSRPARSAPISDEELLPLLHRQEEILLNGLEREWRRVERQVERLGCGESHVVSFSQGVRGGIIKVSPTPRDQSPS